MQVVSNSAACWLIADGMRTGFRLWEKILLLVLYCLPIVYFMPVMAGRAPIGLLLVAWLRAMLGRRGGIANPGRTAPA